MKAAHFEGLYILALVMLSLVWPELDRMPSAAWFLLGLLTLLGLWGRRSEETIGGLPRVRIRRDDLALLAFAMLPTFLHLGLTWSEEFPFTGDHGLHFLVHQLALGFWLQNWKVLVVALLFAVLAHRLDMLHWALPIMALTLVVTAIFVDGRVVFGRYPALSYSVAAPLNLALWKWGIQSPLSSPRLFEALAIPFWLLLLRPLFIDRRKNLWLGPWIAFFFWQKDVVYYFSTVYLEPWSLVWLLLAFERAMTASTLDRRSGACLMVGVAALFKENAILILPLVWVTLRPWSEGLRGFVRSLRTFCVAVAPFLVYFMMRLHYGIGRKFELVEFKEYFYAEKIGEWLYRVETQFEWPMVAVIMALVLFSASMVFRRKASLLERFSFLGLLAFAAFFFCDRQSQPWIGYPRFHLFALVSLAPTLHYLSALVSRYRRGVVVLSSALVLAQLPALASFLALDFESDSARSWIEHYDATSYYPLDLLLAKADLEGGLEGIAALRIVQPAPEGAFSYATMAYPRWSRRLQFHVTRDDPVACRCTDAREAVWVGFQLRTNLQTREVGPPLPHDWSPEARTLCLRNLESSCDRSWSSRARGEIVGVLGRIEEKESATSGSEHGQE